jgi:hypothetical protein
MLKYIIFLKRRKKMGEINGGVISGSLLGGSSGSGDDIMSISELEMETASVVFEMHAEFHACHTEEAKELFFKKVSSHYLPDLLAYDEMVCNDDCCPLKDYKRVYDKYRIVTSRLYLPQEVREEFESLLSGNLDVDFVYRKMAEFLESKKGILG